MLKRDDQVAAAVERLAYGGRGVARVNGQVVFVEGAAPGDLVRARVTSARRSYAEADIEVIERPSPHRVIPRCPHFGTCGGCGWQHIAYPVQTAAKEAFIHEALRHLGGVSDIAVRPIIFAADPWYYRNKMEFSFHPNGVLGLHRRGDWNQIVPIDVCFLQSEASAALVRDVRAFVQQAGLAPYDPTTRAGFLRSLVIREGRTTGDRLIGLLTGPGAFPAAGDFVDVVHRSMPHVTGILRGIVAGTSDGAPVTQTELLEGRPYLEEMLAGLRFRIGLDTFFQTNTGQAGAMVEYVVERAEPLSRQPVIDLYCGVGTFSLALARAGARVTGIELVPAAIAAARTNAELNGLRGVTFVSGDARVMLPATVELTGPPSVLVLDPPRGGAGGKVMRKIGRTGARRIIYVSCNPTTLAPDVRELLPFGYRLIDVQPFDLFPQTYHVEAVAVLDREGTS